MTDKDAKRHSTTLISDVELADVESCQLTEERHGSEVKTCLVGKEEWQVLEEDWQSNPGEAHTTIIIG